MLDKGLRYECVIEHNGVITGRIEAEAFNTSPTERSIQIAGELLDKIDDAEFYIAVLQLLRNWQNQLGAKHAFIKSATPYNMFLVDFLRGELDG